MIKDTIKTFKLTDLVGRDLKIDTFVEDEYLLTFAFDRKTGERFLLAYEIHEKECTRCRELESKLTEAYKTLQDLITWIKA